MTTVDTAFPIDIPIARRVLSYCLLLCWIGMLLAAGVLLLFTDYVHYALICLVVLTLGAFVFHRLDEPTKLLFCVVFLTTWMSLFVVQWKWAPPPQFLSPAERRVLERRAEPS